MLLACRGQGSTRRLRRRLCCLRNTMAMMTADATATGFLLELRVYWYAILPQVRDQLSDILTGPREA